jgi:hypothetical protein
VGGHRQERKIANTAVASTPHLLSFPAFFAYGYDLEVDTPRGSEATDPKRKKAIIVIEIWNDKRNEGRSKEAIRKGMDE